MIDKKVWQYEYTIIYWDVFDEKRIESKGIVIAESGKDAFNKVISYYIDAESDFIKISIEEKEHGEVNPEKLVFEMESNNV